MRVAIGDTLAPQHQLKCLNAVPEWLKKQYGKIKTDFTIDVHVYLQSDRVYRKGKTPDIPDENFFASTNQMSKEVMVSATISWYVAKKPFFKNENRIEVKKGNYCKYLKNYLFSEIIKHMLLNIDPI